MNGASHMATFEYTCINCDYTLEEKRSVHDPEPVHICEKCGYALKKVYKPLGIAFKGGGFYSTSDRG